MGTRKSPGFTILFAGGIGPCPAGHQFIVTQQSHNSLNSTKNAECVCKDGHVKWFGDGACYRPFTRGPCAPGYIYSVNVTVRYACKSSPQNHLSTKMLTLCSCPHRRPVWQSGAFLFHAQRADYTSPPVTDAIKLVPKDLV